MTDYIKFTPSTADEAKPIDSHHTKILRENPRALMEDLKHVLLEGPIVNGVLFTSATTYGDAACLVRVNKVKIPTSSKGGLKKLKWEVRALTTGGATGVLRAFVLPRYVIPGETVSGDTAVAVSSSFSGAADTRTVTVTIGYANTVAGSQAPGVGADLQIAQLGYVGLQGKITAGSGTIEMDTLTAWFSE